MPHGRAALRAATALALATLGAPGMAAAQGTVRITPTIGISETYSDNVGVFADEFARSGWITDVIPAVRVDVNGARLKGFLDYKLHEVRYSGASDLDNTQHTLASTARLEAIEKFLFIDTRADISNRNRTPLQGAVPVDSPTGSANRIETRTFQVSPNARGMLGGYAIYEGRYDASYVSSRGDELPDTRVGEFSGRLRSARGGARIGWAVEGNALRTRSDTTGSLSDNRVRALAIYSVDPLLQVAALYGRETTDFDGTRQSEDTPGAAINWQPSPRSLFAAEVQKRFFGIGHTATASYRTPRTAWRIASSRDAAVLPGIVPRGAGNTTSLFALVGEVLGAPGEDASQRAEAARLRLEAAGISSDFPLATGAVSTRPVVYESQTAAVALLGTRNTATLRFTRLDQRNAQALPADAVPLPGENFRQAGVSATWSYKVTPLTTITASATGLRTEDIGGAASRTRQTLYGAYLTTRLGEQATASFGVRRAEYDSPVPLSTYRENAVVATLQFRL